MATKVKSYRINITDDAQEGDAIVIGQNGGMTSSHLGTVASYDVGTSEGNIQVLGEGGKVSENSLPFSVMKKNIYDPNNKEANVFDYDNLDNTPTIPEVYDAVVTFTQGGVPKGSISLNQSSPTVIPLDAGGVTAGDAIDITNSIVSAKYDGDSIQVNSSNKLEVIDYGTIKSGAAAGATAVQPDDLAVVATTGSYTDLIDKPTIPSAQIQSDWLQDDNTEVDYIKNKPTIGDATITIQKNGTSVGTFTTNDTTAGAINITMDKTDVGLSNVDNTSDEDKPISTATQSALDLKANSADLATVATTGSYTDLTNKPTIGNASLTIQKNGTTISTFGANATSNVTANIEVPTSTNDITNDSGYIDNTVNNLENYTLSSDLSDVATSGSYTDLTDKPTIGNATLTVQKNGTSVGTFNANATTPSTINISVPTTVTELSDAGDYVKDTDLSTVATSGSYNDLSNKPTIGTANLTIQKNGTNVATFGANATSGVTANITVPTAVTDLSDASNYALVSSLADVATSGDYNDLDNLPTIPSVIDNTTSTSTTDALSANQGKLLKDAIDGLAGLGKFLSLWNSATGLPLSFPLSTPYTYSTGDWYMVETVDDTTNYMPEGSSYSGTASTTVDSTNTVKQGDVYIYDGTNWIFQENNKIATSFSAITGQPTDNANLSTALSAKQDVANMVTSLTGADNTHYPTAKAVADAISNFDEGDMLKSIYDPNAVNADAFDYTNFINTPNLSTVATSGSYNDLTDTPSLATVATSGSYADLTNKPTIGTANLTVQKNGTTVATFGANATSAVTANITVPTTVAELSDASDYVTDTDLTTALSSYTPTSSLATVATSGDYDDLSGKPTIGTATLTIQKNGTTVNTFGANATSNVTANITVPTKTSDLTNDSDYVVSTDLATVATSGSYADLSNKPTIPTTTSQLTNNSGYITKSVNNLDNYTLSTSLSTVATSGSYTDLADTPSLSTVATTGDYDDLLNKPTIPDAQVQTDWNATTGMGVLLNKPTLATVATTGSYTDLSNKPSLATVATSGSYNDLTSKPTIPSSVSQLTNDSGYITKSVNNLDNYTLSTDLADVATSGDYTDLTNKPSLATVATSGSYSDLSGTPDLSIYQTTSNLVTSLTGADDTHYPSAKAVADALSSSGYGDMLKTTYDPNNVSANAFDYNNFINTPSLATVATSGSYADLIDTPSIPTKTSDLTNDSGFITSVNTKTFTLSSASDTTNASAAAAFINGGGNAIVILNNIAYSLANKTSSSMVFKGPATTTAGTSSTTINQPTLTFTVSGSTVSAISSTNVSLGSYLEASRNYGTPLTPSYNGSPATKKYVDDSIVTYTAGTGISIDANNVISNTQSSAEWGNITGTLSSQTDLNTALGNKADDSDVVHLTGAETISGVKTFGTTNTWEFDGTNATLYSPSSAGYLYVTRGSGDNAVTMAIKSGTNGGTFGTTTDDQFQFRTNDTMRMQVDSGTNGGKVKLATTSIPATGDNSDYVPSTSWVNTAITNGISGKQDTISDLTTIRSGAAAGATALQSGDNVSELNNDAGYITSSSLPGNATSSTSGLIKLGSDTAQSVSANAVSSTTNRTYAIQKNSNGQAVVNVPWTDTVQEVGNATITLTQEGNSVGSFTTNSSTATTIDLEYGLEYVTQSGYDVLPSSKTSDNRTYLIYEVE